MQYEKGLLMNLNTLNDAGLLLEFAENNNEEAFRILTERYYTMVYAAGLRDLHDEHLAQDACQAVFILLAEKAGKLKARDSIGGWLLRVSVFVVSHMKREERRRKKREKEAVIMADKQDISGLSPEQAVQWNAMKPYLNKAILGLGRRQQEAVIGYYLQNRDQKEIARDLGCSIEAVRMLISRGLNKLRKKLSGKNITVSGAVLSGMLAAERAHAGAAGLAESCCRTAVAGVQGEAAGLTGFGNADVIAKGAMKMMMWAKVKTAAAVLASTALIGSGATVAVNVTMDSGADMNQPVKVAKNTAEKSEITIPEGKKILDTKSFWRIRLFCSSDLVKTKDGRLMYGDPRYPKKLEKKAKLSPTPDPQWLSPEFNDSKWNRGKGPFNPAYGASLLYMRGRFDVKEVPNIKDMYLALGFHGGAVVYVNGKEAGRSYMPKGTIKPDTHAEEYPLEVFVTPDGNPLCNAPAVKPAWSIRKHPERFRKRIRTTNIKIPSSLLKKGCNLLEIELHAAPAREEMYKVRGRVYYYLWPRLAFRSAELTVPPDAQVIPNITAPAGFQVWSHDTTKYEYLNDFAGPNEEIHPVYIAGARNGAFSGKVVAGADTPIQGINALVSDLTGPGTIPASNTQIRWALPDNSKYGNFNGLELFPPENIPLKKKRAVQPIWITVRVPEKAAPGLYKGKISVKAKGKEAKDVPVELEVLPFVLPDPKDFQLFVGMIQSPDSVAMKYNVPMWSDRHWRLMEKSFELLGRVGCKTVYLPIVRRTHFGNEHSMLLWIRKQETWSHDFSIIEKYLDLAVKHLGKVPVVCVYCWEYINSVGKMRGYGAAADRDILISVIDKQTGTISKETGPKWGTPECIEFWKPVMEGMRTRLEARGLGTSMMVGMTGDWEPTKEAHETLKAAAPWARWVRHRHPANPILHKEMLGYLGSVWGLKEPVYGRRSALHVVHVPRNLLRAYHHPVHFRVYADHWLGAYAGAATPNGHRGGIGRIGVDFWPVLRKKTHGHQHGRSLCARYPETQWGQLGLDHYLPHMLSPGRNGAISTIRFELLRENVQEAEARALLEDIVSRDDLKAKAGADLVKRCLECLDERVQARHLIYSPNGYMWYASADCQRLSAKLYRLAGEAQKRIGK